MSIKELGKSGPFVLMLLVAALIGAPFGADVLLETIDEFFNTGVRFPVRKWVTGLFSPKSPATAPKEIAKVDWDRQLADLKAFTEWADGRAEAKITVVRQSTFQIVRAVPNPATTTRISWKLQLISETLDVNATQVRDKLMLLCDPEDKVSGSIANVEPLKGKEKGFLVTVENVRGEGKMGLSYDRLPPIYYDVKLRRMWLVPVASCRSAMKGRYDAAVFFPGMEKGLPEGAVISPGSDKCGYKILSISDHCVWFEAFYGAEPSEDALPNGNWPDFSRVDTMTPTPPPGRLIFGRNRCFWPGDAIKLPNSGAYLMVDDFLAGRAVVFRLLDASMRPVRELLCVIVREK